MSHSSWSTSDFLSETARRGIANWSALAKLLNLHPTTVSAYTLGRLKVPDSVRDRILALTDSELATTLYARVRLRNRTLPTPDTEFDMPPFLMTRSQFVLVVQALKAWQVKIILNIQQGGPLPPYQSERELNALRVIAARLPRTLPYRVYLREHEWPTIASALLDAGGKPRSYYQTWRKSRYQGAPGDYRFVKEWLAQNRVPSST